MAESYQSNYERYKAAQENEDYTQALSCINYLVNRIPLSDQLKLYKVECLAKTGDTGTALSLLKTIPLANSSNPDFWYLKGMIELYGG